MNAEEVRRGLPHSAHLEVELGGHETLPIEAMQHAVTAFLRGHAIERIRLTTDRPRFPDIKAATAAGAARQ